MLQFRFLKFDRVGSIFLQIIRSGFWFKLVTQLWTVKCWWPKLPFDGCTYSHCMTNMLVSVWGKCTATNDCRWWTAKICWWRSEVREGWRYYVIKRHCQCFRMWRPWKHGQQWPSPVCMVHQSRSPPTQLRRHLPLCPAFLKIVEIQPKNWSLNFLQSSYTSWFQSRFWWS